MNRESPKPRRRAIDLDPDLHRRMAHLAVDERLPLRRELDKLVGAALKAVGA